MRVSPARGPVPLVGFRSPRLDPMFLEDLLRSAVLSVTEPSVTRAFMVSSEPGQHKRRAQPASRESRLMVATTRRLVGLMRDTVLSPLLATHTASAPTTAQRFAEGVAERIDRRRFFRKAARSGFITLAALAAGGALDASGLAGQSRLR